MIRYIYLIPFFLVGCVNQPIYTQPGNINNYKYVLIDETPSTSSIVASNGTAHSRHVNPSQLIEGILLKKGLIKVPSASPQTSDKLLLSKFGISGKREVMGGLGGYTQEVTISLIDAQTLISVFSCTAEGMGSSEADDIREAIMNCMSGLK